MCMRYYTFLGDESFFTRLNKTAARLIEVFTVLKSYIHVYSIYTAPAAGFRWLNINTC